LRINVKTNTRQARHTLPPISNHFPPIFHPLPQPFSTHQVHTTRLSIRTSETRKIKTRSARQTTKPEKWAGRRQIFRLELYTWASNEKLK